MMEKKETKIKYSIIFKIFTVVIVFFILLPFIFFDWCVDCVKLWRVKWKRFVGMV